MTREEKREEYLRTILDVIRQLGTSPTREFEFGMDQDHGVIPPTTKIWLKRFEEEGIIKSEKRGATLFWSSIASNNKALSAQGVYAEGKDWVRTTLIEQYLSGMNIQRWASLPGDTILEPFSIEAWILKNNPTARGDGAEKDKCLFDQIMEEVDQKLLRDFEIRRENFSTTLGRLKKREVVLDFTFADYCGGVGPVERETIKTAFEITRPGGVVAVTSGIGYRGAGGYWELYNQDEDNKLCLAMELMAAADEAGKTVASPAILPYKSRKNKDMFALIFRV